jgi:hypothetical protein
VGRSGDGAHVFDDPASPWVVRIWLDGAAIRALRVDARRPGAGRITAAALSRLPLYQMLRVAIGRRAIREHPNEMFYRLLAVPRQRSGRSWDDGHWERVLQIYTWAEETGRPGGGRRAVADLFAVDIDSTVKRWLAEARRRATVADATVPE